MGWKGESGAAAAGYKGAAQCTYISSFAEDTGARACNNHVNKGAFAMAKTFERFYIISKHERACTEVHGEKLNDLNSCKHTPLSFY